MKRFPTSQAGVALIEFAIALPFLMILLLGLIETGRLAYFNILVGNAAHAGAFYGSQNIHTAYDVAGMTAAALRDGQNVPQVTVSPDPTYSCQCYNSSTGASTPLSCSASVSSCATGTHRVIYVQVTASATVNTLFDYRPLGLPNPWTIKRTAILRVSNTAE